MTIQPHAQYLTATDNVAYTFVNSKGELSPLDDARYALDLMESLFGSPEITEERLDFLRREYGNIPRLHDELTRIVTLMQAHVDALEEDAERVRSERIRMMFNDEWIERYE